MPSTPERSSSLARPAIQPVASVSAGPPWGGLYLNPPSAGGLCDGVTTMPSARPAPVTRPPLARRMACETAGVGVYRSSASTSTVTSLAASTSRALTHAGSDRAWVSRPMKSGPSTPLAVRYSQMACVVATMWASLKDPSRLDPRWPDVPNTTCWAGSDGSGTVLK